MEICNSVLKDEIELLSEIYFKEFNSICDPSGCTIIEVIVQPNTCDDVEKQFIRLILRFMCCAEYPAIPPKVSILQPRGIEEEEIFQLKKDIDKIAADKVNEPMLYDLILHAKDVVTNQNIPHTLCSICLESFKDENDVYKTSQFHFFHNQCIANYIAFEIKRHEKLVDEMLENDKFAKNIPELSIQCPLCREEDIYYTLDFIKKFNVPFEKIEIEISDEWRQKSIEMKARYNRQLEIAQANRDAAAAAKTFHVSEVLETNSATSDVNLRSKTELSDGQRSGPSQRPRGRGRGRGDRRHGRGGKHSKDQKFVPREFSQGSEGKVKNNLM